MPSHSVTVAMNSTLHILGITGPIYLAIALGYVFTRQGVFSKADMQVFGKFTLNLALPALLFNALSQRRIGEILNGHYLLAYALGSLLVALGVVSVYCVAGWLERVCCGGSADRR